MTMDRAMICGSIGTCFVLCLAFGRVHADDVVRVADIAPGSGSGGASYLTVFHDTLYFRANGDASTSNAELWRYDGTQVTLAAEINPGTNGSSPAYLTVFDGALYFAANGPSGPPALWRFDGTTAAPAPGGSSQAQNPEDLYVHNGNLLFRAVRSNIGIELWTFDGVNQTPIDLYPGPGSSGPKEFVTLGGQFYMNAVNQEWWRLNAGATGATQVTDIAVGNGSSPESPVVFNNQIYFRANDRVNGLELWRFDGANAALAADIVPGDSTASSYPSGLTVYNTAIYFAADNGIDGSELWRYDGAGASMVANINPTPQEPGVDPVHHSNPSGFRVFDGKLYFSADDGAHGRELFRYDGSRVELVADVWPGATGSEVAGLTVFRDALYFQANDGQMGGELNQLREGLFRLARTPDPHVRVAHTNFDEPAEGSGNYQPGSGAAELGFVTTTQPTGGQTPLSAVVTTSTTPTSPVLAHRSIDATTTLDTVDLSNWDDVTVSLAMQVRATTYEAEDFLRVFVTNGTEELDVFNARGVTSGADPLDDLAGDGYLTYSLAVPDAWTQATLILHTSSNSSAGAERYDFDSIEFRGIAVTTLLGDLNNDGLIDRADVAVLAQHFRTTLGATAPDGDLDSDGAVSLADLALLQSHLGDSLPSLAPSLAAVPEPATVYSAAISLIMASLARLRRRPG